MSALEKTLRPDTGLDALSLTISGKRVASRTRAEVIDPATGTAFASVPVASRQQLDDAVAAAAAAFPSWSSRSWSERRECLLRFCDRVAAEADGLGELVAREVGKPFAKAKAEVGGGVFFARGFAALELKSEILRETETQYVRVEKHPIGVVGAITAWNYPALLAMWKIAPAVLTGNTLVLKPAPSTPLATLRLGEIAQDVFPPGVVNVVSGGDDLGRWMTEHRGIGKIAFTGSVATGKAIMAAASSTLKRLTLELGGNDAAIVLPDFDIERQAEDLFWAAFSNNGQVCACIKRTYVAEPLFDALCDRFAKIASAVKVGAWNEPEVQVGPLQNRKQFDRVTELAADATARGAEAFFRGDTPMGGYFYPITLFKNPPADLRLVTEEQFGPVLPLMRYSDIEHAIREANDTLYGLGASVWGSDTEKAITVARRLKAGNVFVNQHPAMGPEIPYGGIGQSGIGVECGIDGLAEYTNTVVLNVKKV